MGSSSWSAGVERAKPILGLPGGPKVVQSRREVGIEEGAPGSWNLIDRKGNGNSRGYEAKWEFKGVQREVEFREVRLVMGVEEGTKGSES